MILSGIQSFLGERGIIWILDVNATERSSHKVNIAAATVVLIIPLYYWYLLLLAHHSFCQYEVNGLLDFFHQPSVRQNHFSLNL